MAGSRYVAACVALAALGAPAAASAEDGKAVGRFGLVTAGRINLGELGRAYRSGFLLGLHAGIDQPLGSESRWSIGLGWTALVRGYYFATNSSLVEQTVSLTEMDLGFRTRRRTGRGARYITGTLGAILSTTSVPLPPGDDRRYFGAYGGIGYEQPAFGDWTVSVEARSSSLIDGAQRMTLLVGLTAGL